MFGGIWVVVRVVVVVSPIGRVDGKIAKVLTPSLEVGSADTPIE